MKRWQNNSIAAVVLAASFAPALAGPQGASAEHASADTAPTTNRLVDAQDAAPWNPMVWSLQRDLSADLVREFNLLQNRPAGAISTNHTRELSSLEPGMREGWLGQTTGVARGFSQPAIDDLSGLLTVKDSPLPAADVASLSVPEVPLPLNVIPAFVGIVTVLVIHQRSLRGRKTRK